VEANSWYCIMRAENYRIVYVGRSMTEAQKATDEATCCAASRTLGEARRLAAIGAGKLTQCLRAAQRRNGWESAEFSREIKVAATL
jgi:hypothetical protein